MAGHIPGPYIATRSSVVARHTRASNLRSRAGAPMGETAQAPALQPLPAITTPTLVIRARKVIQEIREF